MGERILREEGYEVVSVTDGETAVKRLTDVDPDLMIVDVFLPGRNGFELCRYVKAQPAHRHVSVVMTAGMLEVFDEEEAHRAGADAIVRKPFEASAVLATIKPLVEGSAASRLQVEEPLAAEPEAIGEPETEEQTAAETEFVDEAEAVEEPAEETEFVEEPEIIDASEFIDEPVHSAAGEHDQAPVAPAPPPTPWAHVPQIRVPQIPHPGSFAEALPQATRTATTIDVVAKPVKAPKAEIDPELVRAAVTIALDELMGRLVDDITDQVVEMLKEKQ